MSIVEQDAIFPSAPENDLDQFRDRLNSAYYPARVDAVGGTAHLANGRLNAHILNSVTIGFVRFGHQAMVDPGVIDGFHVNVPVAGTVGSICGDKSMLAAPGTAAIFTRNGPTRLPYWSDDAAQVCVKISRSAVARELDGLLGRPAAADLDFAISMPLRTRASAAWQRSLWSLVEAVTVGDVPKPVLDHLERAMICQLLFAADHNYATQVRDPGHAVVPQTIQSVLDLIDSSPETLFTAADLARHARVGVRRLEQAFHDHMGMTPSAYHAQVRLERAHSALVDLQAGDTVTSVMYRWGFTNHSRFATAYRRRFGENPSATIARAAAD